jgi:hypothetical protein
MAKYKPKLKDKVRFHHVNGKQETGTICFVSSDKKFVSCYPNSVGDLETFINVTEIIGEVE